MLYLFITSINENIHFARHEQVGNQYQRPLENLLQLISEHRLLARDNKTGQLDAEIKSKESQIDSAFANLITVDSQIGVELEFTPDGLSKRNRQGCDAQSVLGRWKSLKSQMNTLDPAARDQANLQLIADIRTMIAHAGDMSNLILDPELDSYYLVDVTLMALPQTQDRLAQVMADGEDVIRGSGNPADPAKYTLVTDLTLLKQDDLDRITSSTNTALSNGNPLYGSSPSFHRRVPPMLSQYVDAATKFDDLTAKIINDGPQSVSTAQYLAAGHLAQAASFRLWTVADEELDGILQNRIDYYTFRRTRSLGVAASAFLAAIGLVTFITRSISGPLKRQTALLKAANEELSQARMHLEHRVVQSDAELQRTEDKYRSIFEDSIMGIFQTSPEGTYLKVNRALAKIYGYNSPEELQANLSDIERLLYVDPNRRGEFIRMIDDYGFVTDFESQVRRKDASVLWISENARGVRDSQGKLLYYEGTIQDITQRKRAEEEELRARELAQSACVAAEEARAAAEAASTAKSDFLAVMSHEIRTPLNGVIGIVDLLLGTSLTAQQTRYANVIKSSSDTLLNLINQILDFSKIEAGHLELDEQNFNLHFVVEEVASVLAQRAASKGLELVCKIDQSVPTLVQGDGERLRQVLINLVNNAVKFTSSGEVVVHVSSIDRPEVPGPSETNKLATLKFSVSDTGIGIPPERLDRLFKSFSQVDTSITRQYGGTGLGLAISKQLVELMGGQIGVESVPRQGSTFWFTIQLRQCDYAREALPTGLDGHRVLVVDDNLTQCQLLREQLLGWGARVDYATSGVEAIQLVDAAMAGDQRFAAAIVDFKMPGMDGLAMAKVLRMNPALRDLPLILMSGVDNLLNVDPEIFVRSLMKPVRQSQLFDTLMTVLNKPASAAPAATIAPHTEAEPEAAQQHNAKSIRILLAEDLDVNQFVVTETLARAGYTCDIANNGREAVEAVKKKHYDVVLMDCQMPEMSGFEAASAIREYEQETRLSRPPVSIVALTANAVKGDRDRCLAAGMDEYLTKPLDAKKLIETIKMCAAKSSVPSAPAFGESDVAAAPDQEERPAFNYSDLLTRCEGDMTMLARLVEKFEKRSGEIWTELLTSYKAGDAAATGRLAHALKGSASNLSAVYVSKSAAGIEDICKSGELAQAESLIQQLGDELERCHQAFGKFDADLKRKSQLPTGA
jgi:Amt family ammonium transporter